MDDLSIYKTGVTTVKPRLRCHRPHPYDTSRCPATRKIMDTYKGSRP